MEPSLVLAKFDSLIEKGLVFYDDEQQTVELVDQGLKVRVVWLSCSYTGNSPRKHDTDIVSRSSNSLLLMPSRISQPSK